MSWMEYDTLVGLQCIGSNWLSFLLTKGYDYIIVRYFLPLVIHFQAILARLFRPLHSLYNMNLATIFRLSYSVKLAMGLRNCSNSMEVYIQVGKRTVFWHKSLIHSIICFGSPIIQPKCGHRYLRSKSILVSLWWQGYWRVRTYYSLALLDREMEKQQQEVVIVYRASR